MTPEQRYIEQSRIEHRRAYAQFFTPYRIADMMTEWILQGRTVHTILEPAFGLGLFSRILKQKNPELVIRGIEIDRQIYDEAVQVCGADIPVLNGDYLTTHFEHKFDGMIANPPYLKFQEYDNKRYIDLINRQYGYQLSGFTNIYALFLLKSINELADGGRCAYIVPSEFLNADYGKAVKAALLQSGTLRHIIVFDSQENLFDDAITTSCIIYCEKGGNNHWVNFVSISSIADAEVIPDITSGRVVRDDITRTYAVSDLDPEIKWKNYLEGTGTYTTRYFVPFHIFAKVKRGIATGANDFFTFNLKKSDAYHIPKSTLRPCICHCTDVKGFYFDDAAHQKLVSENKYVYILDIGNNPENEAVTSYIRLGEQTKIHERFLTSKRNPWFAVERRMPPPIWVTVFNRTRLRFIRNVSQAVNLTTFHCIYTTNIVSDDLLFAYLLTDIAHKIFNNNAREYGNGLRKFEPNDLNNAQMLDLRLLPQTTVDQILERYHTLIKTGNSKIIHEINILIEEYIANQTTHSDTHCA